MVHVAVEKLNIPIYGRMRYMWQMHNADKRKKPWPHDFMNGSNIDVSRNAV